MRAQDSGQQSASEKETRAPGHLPPTGPVGDARTAQAALLAQQSRVGNAAVLQMLHAAGHPGVESGVRERHQHDAGCGHQRAEQPQVQRSAVRDTLRSAGRPLDEATRSEMEARLGADFTDVRIHDNSGARASAAEVGARAYTSGNHVVIGAGGGDKHTLAHELTHVIQQRQGPVAGTDNGSGLKMSDPSDRFEREAEANAARVLSGPVPDGPVAAQRSTAAPSSASPAVQRREENPHAKDGERDGWPTTAHHIVAHATLTTALDKLSEGEKMDVLTAAIPKVITEKMLANLKVKPPKAENTPDFRKGLRAQLADVAAPNTESVYGIPFEDIRYSFFEWQAGNQFVGPNTSLRAEPSADGDDIDTDGKYFTSLSGKEFDRLTSLGANLKKPGLENPERTETLKKILRLTKDQEVADFDPAQWTEVEDGATVDELAADAKLSRAHITKYTYFKLLASDVRDGKYHDFAPATGGAFTYYGKPLASSDAKARGGFVYIPYTTGATPPPKEGKRAGRRQSLKEFCEVQKVPTCTFLPKELYNPRKPAKK